MFRNRDREVALERWEAWRLADLHRLIDWAFTPWSDPEFSNVYNYRLADRWDRRVS